MGLGGRLPGPTTNVLLNAEGKGLLRPGALLAGAAIPCPRSCLGGGTRDLGPFQEPQLNWPEEPSTQK